MTRIWRLETPPRPGGHPAPMREEGRPEDPTHDEGAARPPRGRRGAGMSGRGISRVVADGLHAALILMVIGAALFIGLLLENLRLDEARSVAADRAQNAAAAVAAQLQRMMNEHVLVARAVSAMIRRDPDVTQKQYQSIVADVIDRGDQTILNVALLKDSTIVRVYPLERNAKALGTDMTYVHAQLPGLNLSRRDLRLTLSGPFSLVQGGKGLIYRFPVLVPDPGTGRSRYWGSVGVVVSLERMMADADIAEMAEGHRIAIRSLDSAGQPRETAYGDATVFENDPKLLTLRLPFGSWQVGAVPDGGWPTAPRNPWESWLWVLAVTAVFLLLIHFIRRLTMQRENARSQLVRAIESIRDGFVMYDAEQRLVLCNNRYRELYGLRERETRPGTRRVDVARTILARGIIAGAEGQEEKWLARRFEELKQPTHETEHRHVDGRWLRLSDVRMPDGYSVGLRTDITELKEALIRAEEASRAKSEFLSTVSHELRTPLTSIKGGVGLVLSGKLGKIPDKARDFLQIACNNSDRLTGIVNDILDMQKIEAGRIDYRFEPLDVGEMVEQAVAANLSYAERFNVTYVVESITGPRAVIRADRNRFLQIMDNLLSNAAKFSLPGGRVEVSLAVEDGQCRVSVRDHGRGIAPEDHDKLFSAFSQIDSSDTREKEGSGLGLAICKRLVEEMGGRIGLKSAPGKGSEFFVIFPVLEEAASIG